MEPLKYVKIPKNIPNCPFTQEPVVDAIIGICGHLFDKSDFLKYTERGGRDCPICRKKVEWYTEIPNFRDKLGQEVSGQWVKLEGEHRIERYEETTSLEEGFVLNLFLIERVVSEGQKFFDWCMEKDSSAILRIQAELNYHSVTTKSQVDALQVHQAIAKKLYDSFEYRDCGTIQEFVNKFFGNDLNFFLYNLLLKKALLYQFSISAKKVMGGEVRTERLDVKKIVDGAELGKKLRAAIGLVMTLSLIIGIGRKISSFYSSKPPLPIGGVDRIRVLN